MLFLKPIFPQLPTHWFCLTSFYRHCEVSLCFITRAPLDNGVWDHQFKDKDLNGTKHARSSIKRIHKKYNSYQHHNSKCMFLRLDEGSYAFACPSLEVLPGKWHFYSKHSIFFQLHAFSPLNTRQTALKTIGNLFILLAIYMIDPPMTKPVETQHGYKSYKYKYMEWVPVVNWPRDVQVVIK